MMFELMVPVMVATVALTLLAVHGMQVRARSRREDELARARADITPPPEARLNAHRPTTYRKSVAAKPAAQTAVLSQASPAA